MYRTSPVDYESLSPRVMNIPDDPLRTGDDLGCPWNPDTQKLLKVIDEQSILDLERLIKCGAPVNGHGGAFHETPLHKAAQQGWVEGVQLLLAHGATGQSTNQFGQTPLHYAAASKSFSCVKSLLDSGVKSSLEHKDMRGHTPLHDAAAVGHPEGVTLLLKAGASVDANDKNDETPLHKAAKVRCIACMLSLLNKGADIGAKDKYLESVLSYILRHIPAGMENLLDHCLVSNQDKIASKKLEVTFNFIPLAGNSEMNQMKILNTVVDLGHPKLLLHPLCEGFLLLKWHNVRRLFFIEVIFYFIHAILATFLILNKFVWEDVIGTVPECIDPYTIRVLEIMLFFQAGIILLKQLLTITQNFRTWIFSLWHVLNTVIPVLVIVVVPGPRMLWQHHLATITVLLIWVQCMLHIGRFPGCGIYVAMFTRVAKVFLRIFLIFFCLLLAFSMSFYVSNFGNSYETDENGKLKTIKAKEEDANPIMTFMKTLTMMIGELDFDAEFVKQLGYLKGTSHIIYLAFVILVSIILSNLLVALAVNDVQGLRNSAHLERLIKQMELVFQMEKTFGTVANIASYMNFSWLAGKVMLFVHNFIKTKVFMQPYNPQKGSKLLVLNGSILKEINLRQSHVMNVMECLRLREEESSDRKMSVRKTKSRKVRSEYSAFNTTDDDMRDALKQVERNLMETMNERLDEIVDTFASLSTRIKTIEEALPTARENLDKRNSNVVGLLASNGNIVSGICSAPRSPKLPFNRQSQPSVKFSPAVEGTSGQIARAQSQPLKPINSEDSGVVIEMSSISNNTKSSEKKT